jgi:hypothetical protein
MSIAIGLDMGANIESSLRMWTSMNRTPITAGGLIAALLAWDLDGVEQG